MTGTAMNARGELRHAFGLNVAVIPTHRPCVRRGLPHRIFTTQAAKRAAVAREIQRLSSAGRAVLVGTPSVGASESLGATLTGLGVEHVVLNARFDAQEADIVAQAGQPGRVTIATNMAGRGTDICLHDDVRKAGGLHVIATEMHTSARIDRQLVGRAARQGDPGSYQFFLSLEDELLQSLPPETVEGWRAKHGGSGSEELAGSWLRVFRECQSRLERHHARIRRQQLKAERQRRQACHAMGLDPCLELPEGR